MLPQSYEKILFRPGDNPKQKLRRFIMVFYIVLMKNQMRIKYE
jgi:hypothetical protein